MRPVTLRLQPQFVGDAECSNQLFVSSDYDQVGAPPDLSTTSFKTQESGPFASTGVLLESAADFKSTVMKGAFYGQ